MKTLYRVAYCSRSCLTGSAAEVEVQLRRIIASARRNNRQAGLTGAMAFNEGHFAQVLEGSADDLAQVMKWIRADPRHAELQVLERVEIGTRSFPAWSMAYVGPQNGRGYHPLSHFRFETALTEGATAEATILLDALRRVVTAGAAPTESPGAEYLEADIDEAAPHAVTPAD